MRAIINRYVDNQPLNVKARAGTAQSPARAASLRRRQSATDVVRVGQAATFGLDKVLSGRAPETLTVDRRATHADDTKNAWGAARAPP
jgi:hypothetical protein